MTFRSNKLRDSFRDAPQCFGCGKHNDGTVVGAHANGAHMGKGMGHKAPDYYLAGLCYDCHVRLDQGKDMTRDERRQFWLDAYVKTMAWWFDAGIVTVN